MKKQVNPLQNLIDEMNQNKKVHAQLAKNAESERNRYNDNYVHFEQGVAYGFELAIEIVAKFNFWNDARTNPPKFDKNRINPHYSKFIGIVQYHNISSYIFTDVTYDFSAKRWVGSQHFEVMYWQEYPVMSKGLVK